MAKKKKILPENFWEIMQNGDFEEIKAVFKDTEITAHPARIKEYSPFFTVTSNSQIYKWFVEQGLDIHAEVNWEQAIHYHAKCQINNLEGLLQAGANIEAQTHWDKDTPLHVAARVVQTGSIKTLLLNGANVHALNCNNKEPLELVFYRRPNLSDLIREADSVELLLNAGAIIEDWMKDKIIELSEEFERGKENIYTNDLKPYEEAMARLCKMFDVNPVKPRIHDGVSFITVTSENWQDQHNELWDYLIPSVGKCKTVQGEIIRIGGRIYNEIMRNAGGNWDTEYRKMLNALKNYYYMGKTYNEEEIKEAINLIQKIGPKDDGSAISRLCEINVHWVLANPEPIMLQEVNYTR